MSVAVFFGLELRSPFRRLPYLEDVKLTKELKKVFSYLTEVYNKRETFIEELQRMKCSTAVVQSVAFLNDIQRRDMEKATQLLIMVKETQLWRCEKVLT
ncbi:hypothetical protein Tco_0151265 [Tanacetum coccineum]